jgi:hypothetical protein
MMEQETYGYWRKPGKLHFIIDDSGWGRNNWREGARFNLEEDLNEVVKSLIGIAGYRQVQHAKSEEAERQRQEAERIRLERERQRELEQEHFAALVKQANDWTTSRRLHEYLVALKIEIVNRTGEIEPESGLARWFGWATDRANGLDPLQSKDPLQPFREGPP